MPPGKFFKQHPDYPPGINTDFEKNFWKFVDKKSDNECWNWTNKRTNGRGYGRTYTGYAKWMYAHRASWLINKGPIPDGLFVCHKCDNPSCCNPNHLWLGTNADNQKDKFAKGRDWQSRHPEKLCRGENHPRCKLTDEQVLEIRQTYKPWMGGKLARKFRCSPSTIHLIVKGKSRQKLKVALTPPCQISVPGN